MASNTATDNDRDRTTDYDRDRTTDSDYDRDRAYSNTDTRRSDVDDTSDRDTTINRIEENMEVGKRTVERDGVRVRSRVVEKPVEENVRLREERVNVERNPVDRPADRDDLANFQERDIELTERAEVPVVNKEARVVEEIRVSKDVSEREETVRDTVRRTDVDVEKLSGDKNDDSTYRDTDYDKTNRDGNTRL
jgi:stress response protein YsnF